MDYLITNGDTLAEFLDPQAVANRLINGRQVFEDLKELQKFTDDTARYKAGVKMAGGTGDIKIIARIPQAALIALLAVEPDLLRDKKTFNRILKKYPIYAAYTRKASGGAA